MIPQNVLDAQQSYISAIKAWCQSQLATWQQVPYWALMANYQHGFGYSDLAVAYESGYWRIEASMGIYDFVAIDCETGALRVGNQTSHRLNLQRLDAEHILEQLQTRAATPDKFYLHPNAIARNKYNFEQYLQKLDLGPDKPYRRLVLTA